MFEGDLGPVGRRSEGSLFLKATVVFIAAESLQLPYLTWTFTDGVLRKTDDLGCLYKKGRRLAAGWPCVIDRPGPRPGRVAAVERLNKFGRWSIWLWEYGRRALTQDLDMQSASRSRYE